MESGKNSREEPSRQSLRVLLDDPSPVVRAALLEEFRRQGAGAAIFLREWAAKGSGSTSESARWFLKELGVEDTVEDFISYIRAGRYDLETGSLLLARAYDPGLDPMGCVRFLDEVALRCSQLFLDSTTAFERCRVLNRVLFHEYGFVGATEGFYHPENSFIHSVIERRRGIPITLSIIYLLVALRCGMDLEPIGLPGRFVVGCFLDDEPFFIDPYARGVFRSVEDLEKIVESFEVPFEFHHLTPTPISEVLLRCCRNLLNQYGMQKDGPAAQLSARFIDELETLHKTES